MCYSKSRYHAITIPLGLFHFLFFVIQKSKLLHKLGVHLSVTCPDCLIDRYQQSYKHLNDICSLWNIMARVLSAGVRIMASSKKVIIIYNGTSLICAPTYDRGTSCLLSKFEFVLFLKAWFILKFINSHNDGNTCMNIFFNRMFGCLVPWVQNIANNTDLVKQDKLRRDVILSMGMHHFHYWWYKWKQNICDKGQVRDRKAKAIHMLTRRKTVIVPSPNMAQMALVLGNMEIHLPTLKGWCLYIMKRTPKDSSAHFTAA